MSGRGAVAPTHTLTDLEKLMVSDEKVETLETEKKGLKEEIKVLTEKNKVLTEKNKEITEELNKLEKKVVEILESHVARLAKLKDMTAKEITDPEENKKRSNPDTGVNEDHTDKKPALLTQPGDTACLMGDFTNID